MENTKLTKTEILECIVRSGYLLESRLVSSLNKSGFFVDPNQVIEDEITGKSREIDIIAEHYRYRENHGKTCVKTHFIIEAINNLHPMVLTTKRPFSPNSAGYEYIKYWATPNEEPFGNVDIWEGKEPEEYDVFSQYCAITKKRNGELMASHTDDLYSSLNKMVQYCNSQLDHWRDRNIKDEFWRVFFWQPILVLQNDLMYLDEKEDGSYELIDIPSAKLEFNYHTNNETDSIAIDIVTEKHFINLLMDTVAKDENIETNLVKCRHEENA